MINESELRAKHSEQSDELRRQLQEKDQVLQNYRLSHGKLELFFADLKDFIQPLTPVEPIIREVVPGKKAQTMVLHISDGHLGSVQMPEEIEGFNEFNVEICRARQIDYVNRAIDVCEKERLAHHIPECVVLVTGDMISGDIHDELKITNEIPLPQQAIEAGNLLGQQLLLLAQRFERVVCHFLTEDNHSRLTKKPQAKEAGLNSMNYVVGYIAKMRIAGQENVDFRIYPQYEKVVEVNGRNYLLMHGHNIRGWAGIPWYGVERKIAKESTARMQLMLKNKSNQIGFHKLVMGHFRTPVWHPLYIMSGSVQGTDAYDHKDGRYADPSQSSWFVHPDHAEWGRIDYML